jgi:hypothetical protein
MKVSALCVMRSELRGADREAALKLDVRLPMIRTRAMIELDSVQILRINSAGQPGVPLLDDEE